MLAPVLLLNADYSPVQIIPWQRAVGLILEKRALLAEDYPGRRIRSPSISLPRPAVVVLKRYVRSRPRIRFSRANILARDEYRCGYCGLRPVSTSGQPAMDALTIDHVIPRSQARSGRVELAGGRSLPVSCWQNTVTACRACNASKGARTPAQAGLTLQIRPRRPTAWDLFRIHLGRTVMPVEWAPYLPASVGGGRSTGGRAHRH